jgi:hypothetical protein
MQAWAQPFAEWVTTDGSMPAIAFDYASQSQGNNDGVPEHELP